MKFPNLMYRSPGPNHAPGGTFEWCGVKCLDDVMFRHSQGWYPTVELAIDPPEDYDVLSFLEPSEVEEGVVEGEDPTPEDTVPPTREELEQKAKELGIGFNKNTKDEVLLDRINEELADLEGEGE